MYDYLISQGKLTELIVYDHNIKFCIVKSVLEQFKNLFV